MIKIEGFYQARAEVARALAHPVRMQIIDILSTEGEKCVSDLTDLLQVGQSSVSKHLRVLRNAGIVRYEKEGLQVLYRIRTPCIADLFRCLDTIILEDLRNRQRHLGDAREEST